jgi:hypothetical protein
MKKLLLLLFLLVPSVAGAEVFGKQTVETAGRLSIEATTCWGSFHWYDASGKQLDSLTVYIQNESVARNIRVALFKRTSSTTWTLVDSAIEKSVPVDTDWVSFPAVNNAILENGCYRIQAWAQAGTNGIYVVYGTGSALTDSVTSVAFSGYDGYNWPATLSVGTPYYYDISAYATISVPPEGSTSSRRRRIIGGSQ